MSSLAQVWEGLISQGASIDGHPVALWSGGLVVASVGSARTPQLLIQLRDIGSPDLAAQAQRLLKVNGLVSTIQNLSLNNVQAPCFVISPSLPKYNGVFFSLAEYLVDTIKLPSALNPSVISVETVIKEWIDFFRKPSDQTSREKILGLIGELLAIRDWLDVSKLQGKSWTGPAGLPQDFRGNHDALEVKVLGSRTGPVVHKISSLHQLQVPSSGRLFVLSLRITLGSTGHESVHDLVKVVGASPMFADPLSQSYFWESVWGQGYSDDLDSKFSHFDVTSTCLYQVTDGFPNLGPDITKNDARVFDVVYSLDFSGLTDFIFSDKPIRLLLN